MQGEVKEVKERHVNQNSTIPLILGGVIMLKNFINRLSMMYWGRSREITVTSLIVTENVAMKKREALLKQTQGSFPGIGDHISLYGKEKQGVLLVKRGYNHDTNCELVCR